MEESDKPQFFLVMTALAENYGAQLSATGLAMRFESLRDYSIDAIKQAAMAIARGRKYTTMPTVADFLEHIEGGRAEDVAEIEAAKVWRAVKEYGGCHSVCFDNPVTQAVIVNGFGGWTKMCSELMEDQHKWFIKDFCRSYGAFSRQGVRHYGPLIGYAPRIDRGPFLIGDKAKAREVLAIASEKRGEVAQIGEIAGATWKGPYNTFHEQS